MDTDNRVVAQKIVESLNCLSLDEQHIGFEMAEAHPTLQQSAMRMVVGFLQAMAKKKYVDDRNRRAHELAQRLLKDVPEDDLYLPLI